MSLLYNIAITGGILDGFQPESVYSAFSKTFSLPEDKVQALFESKKKFVVKKGVDEQTAKKYLTALNRIGVEAFQEEVAPKVASVESNVDKDVSNVSAQASPDASFQTAQAEEVVSDEPVEESFSREEAFEPQAQAATTEAPTSQYDTEEEQKLAAHPFEFSGNGWEFFKIWIVNTLLSIVTLGIYSAWAKVRNNRYMYSNLSVAGSSFKYHATPMMILRSRIVALVAFLIFFGLSQWSPAVSGLLGIGLFIAIPWIMVKSLQFRARMSSWRNIRFGFDGSVGEAFMVFFVWQLLGAITLGLLMPYALYKQTEYVLDNSRFGTSQFTLEPCAGDYVKIFFMALGIIICAAIIGFLLGMISPIISVLISVCAYFFAFVFISVRIGNLIMNSWTLEDAAIGFESTMQESSYVLLVLKNSALTLITLGFYYPAAMVNVARYRAEHLTLNSTISLDNFVAGEEKNVNALGEEMGDMFDVELAI